MRKPAPAYGPLQKGERQPLADILGVSFGLAPDLWTTWMARLGEEKLRVARKDGVVVGGLAAYRFGHFYGGKSVQSAGIAGVGIAPEHRAGGVAREMLQAMLREERERGTPIATLFASTQYLYRSLGFEHAGHSIQYRAPVASLRPAEVDRTLLTRRIRKLERATFEAMYVRTARENPGQIDRDDAMWDRKFSGHGTDEVFAYVFGPAEAPEGYLLYLPKRTDQRTFDLRVRDMVWNTPRAARGILRFLYDQRSLVGDALWQGPPNDPLQTLIAEQCVMVENDHSERFFARILNVKKALEARGYRSDGELTFTVEDPIFEENSRAWTLSVKGKRPTVKPADKARMSVTINGLASLFSGMYDATKLASVGLMAGPASSIAMANVLFAGAPPWISDMF